MNASNTRYHVGPDSQEAKQILDAIDRWLEREVAPHVMKLEHDDVWPAQMVEQMKELGLFGATISPLGGGLSAGSTAASSRGFQGVDVAHGDINSHLIWRCWSAYGNTALKQKYLPRFAREIRGGLARPSQRRHRPRRRTRAQEGEVRLNGQDVDLQRHPGLVLRCSRRPSGAAAPQGA